MPLYEYTLEVDGNEVWRVSIPLPVADRDRVTLTRCPLPRSVSIGGVSANPETQAAQVLNSCKRIESRLGASEFQRRIGMPSGQMKQVWSQ